MSPDAGAAPQAAEPIMAYRALVQGGVLQPDPTQQLAIERLQSLYRALLHYRPETGPVGRGKSMLMDLFFRSVPKPSKRRVHFHAFMLDVHDRMERERRAKTEKP